ncbi:MAG: hypothetical protein GY929_20715 [Actinomycetia bacterium]|nr:hypothetical protein [Actinomycetes bacterium]
MWRRITVFAGLVSIVGAVLMQSPASAGHGDISVPLDTIIQADAGEVVQLVSVPVDPELVGATCSWDFHATNQESVHPGNDLILSTGGTDTVVAGVEDAPDQVLDAAGSVQLGETVTVSLRMGADQVFSAGLSVEVVCEGHVGPSNASTTVPASTTTAAPTPTTTTPAPTTTTAPEVETEVAGKVETAGPAAPAAAAPALAATGPSSSTGPLVGFAVVLLLIGFGLLGLGIRARR